MADDAGERESADYRLGHPRLGEFADVGWDPIQLVECPAPAPRAGTAGCDQEAVYVNCRSVADGEADDPLAWLDTHRSDAGSIGAD